TGDQAGDTVRGLHGVIDVDDDGRRIVVTMQGWIYERPWKSYRMTVHTVDHESGSQDPIPDVTTGVVRNHVTWYGCDLTSGRIIAELPNITGGVSRIIGDSTSASFS